MLSFACECLATETPEVSNQHNRLQRQVEAPQASPIVKPAENINLKEVVSEPLASDVNSLQGELVGEPEQAGDSQAEKHVPHVKPAKNVDLKKVVDQPLQIPEASPPATPLVVDPELDVSVPAHSPQPLSPVSSEPDTVVVTEEADSVNQDSKAGKNILESIANELLEDDKTTQQAPLVLLNSEVLPGTSTRLAWSPSVSFMGIAAPTAVLVVNGVKAGPTMCLTAAVHGDELNGIEIVRRVLYNIDPEKLSGAVIGVPIVNLQGFRSGSRYLSDRRDLNRFFPGNPDGSSASRIAYSFFHEVVSHCDMLVDLHTGSFRRTNLPQLRADLNYPEVTNLSQKMGAIVVVQSVGAEGSLRRAATEHGIPTVTLEAGAPHELQKSAVEHGVKSVESALDGLGFIKRRRFWQRAAEPVYYQSTWVRSKEGGILFSEIELGAQVKEGDLLGTVTDPITNLRSEIRSPYNGRVIGMALNQVMYPGFAAYHIGLKASVDNTSQQVQQMEGSQEIETSDHELAPDNITPTEINETASEDISIEQMQENDNLNLPGNESD